MKDNNGVSMMLDINKAKQALEYLEDIRKEIGPTDQYLDLPYEEMIIIYQLIKAKSAEKFIEGWVANLIGGRKLKKAEAGEEYAQNDLGDIQLSKSKLDVGVNNIELKASMMFDGKIRGGQLRFNEPVAGYMFFKTIDKTRYEMFLLTKEQLVNEIKERARLSGRSAYQSSQGSGVISKLSPEEKIARLDENVAGTKRDKIGWSFNINTENEYYESFKSKYMVSPDDLKTRYAV